MLGPLASSLRQSVLQQLRLAPAATCGELSAPAVWTLLRRFAEGTYLDRAQVTDRVIQVVKNFDKVDSNKVSPSANFQKDLGLDSLDVVEVVMAFEEEFAIEIPDSEADKILSIEDAVTYLASHPQAK